MSDWCVRHDCYAVRCRARRHVPWGEFVGYFAAFLALGWFVLATTGGVR